MNRKLILGIIIALVILIVGIIALIIAGPKDKSPLGGDGVTNNSDLSSDLENLDSQDASIIDQNLDSTIVNLGE